MTEPARTTEPQSPGALRAAKRESAPIGELSASAAGGGLSMPLAGLALGSVPSGPSGAREAGAATGSDPTSVLASLRRMAAVTRAVAAAPAGKVRLRRAIDLSELEGEQVDGLVAAYRADQTGSAMWGRESDLQGLASSLGVRIHVVDYAASQGADYSTEVQHVYGAAGRDIYLRYTGDHYNILHPDPRGRFALVDAGIETTFGSEPVTGDGNCLFAAVWKSARAESDAKHQQVAPDQPRPNGPGVGQAFLRSLCHGDLEPAVSDEQILNEVAILDPASLAREHIGPALTNALGALQLLAAPAAVPGAADADVAFDGAKLDLGPDAVKKVEDMKLAPDVVKARLARFANAPAYWAGLKWRAVDDNLMKADLLPGHPKFDEIAAAVAHGLTHRPYVSSAQESTRMEVVRASVKRLNEAGALDQVQADKKAALERRLHEGSKVGSEVVAPPRSRPVDIDRIEVIANQRLWTSYQAATRSVRDDLASRGDSEPLAKVSFDGQKSQLLDPRGGLLPAGEANLFHGTSPSTMDILESSGFDPSYSANKAKPGAKTARYGPLGQGVYFADVMSKAMTYSQCPVCSDYDCEKHRDQAAQMMMARVALGHTKKAHAFLQSGNLRADDMRTLKDGRHSVYSKGFAASGNNPFSAASGLNEFVVKEAAQVYPEFRIHYRVKPPAPKK